jgi:hypothetical protein
MQKKYPRCKKFPENAKNTQDEKNFPTLKKSNKNRN